MSSQLPADRDTLLTFLKNLDIETTTRDHIPVFTVDEARQVHGEIAGGHCKNLFCKDEKGELWLIVALEDARIDLKATPAIIGSKRLSFGKPELLMQVLGVAPGSVTPFALINDRPPTVNVILDAAMMALPLLNFHPLRNDATTSIHTPDLLKFIMACGHRPQTLAVSTPLP
jgi:Ala-tRNA(Pro) deacylase